MTKHPPLGQQRPPQKKPDFEEKWTPSPDNPYIEISNHDPPRRRTKNYPMPTGPAKDPKAP